MSRLSTKQRQARRRGRLGLYLCLLLCGERLAAACELNTLKASVKRLSRGRT